MMFETKHDAAVSAYAGALCSLAAMSRGQEDIRKRLPWHITDKEKRDELPEDKKYIEGVCRSGACSLSEFVIEHSNYTAEVLWRWNAAHQGVEAAEWGEVDFETRLIFETFVVLARLNNSLVAVPKEKLAPEPKRQIGGKRVFKDKKGGAKKLTKLGQPTGRALKNARAKVARADDKREQAAQAEVEAAKKIGDDNEVATPAPEKPAKKAAKKPTKKAAKKPTKKAAKKPAKKAAKKGVVPDGVQSKKPQTSWMDTAPFVVIEGSELGATGLIGFQDRDDFVTVDVLSLETEAIVGALVVDSEWLSLNFSSAAEFQNELSAAFVNEWRKANPPQSQSE